MPMQAQSLEILERANVPPATARAFVQAIEIEIGAAKDTLATKQDLADLRVATKQDLADLRVATKHDLLDLRHDLVSRIERSHSDLEIKMTQLENRLDVKMANTKAELVRWVLLTMLSNVALGASTTAVLNILQRAH